MNKLLASTFVKVYDYGETEPENTGTGIGKHGLTAKLPSNQ